MPKKLIYVTGFGVFEGHETVNSSWEAVSLLPNTITLDNYVFDIKKVQVPVIYDEVDKIVPKIWSEDPVLVIHCGVTNCDEKKIILETCAHNRDLCRPDFSKKKLPFNQAILESNGKNLVTLYSTLKVKQFSIELNLESPHLKVPIYKFSLDPGKYLCSYIYLKSLDISFDRVLFIHVPPLNQPFSSLATKDAIYRVIVKCIEQLRDENKF